MNKNVALILALTGLMASASAFALDDYVVRDGDSVVTRGGHDAKVLRTVGPGQVEIYNYGLGTTEIKSVDEIAKSKPGNCERSLNPIMCTGERVITKSGHTGKLLGLFSDGEAAVRFDSGRTELRSAKYDLADAHTGTCRSNLCVGQDAYTGSGHLAIVQGIFQDGGTMVSSTAEARPHYEAPGTLRDFYGMPYYSQAKSNYIPANIQQAPAAPSNSNSNSAL